MDSGNRLTLKIGPLTLNVIATEDSARLERLAARLDSELTALLASNTSVTLAQALAALTLQSYEETQKANDSADNLRGLLKTYLEDLNRQKSETAELRREIERLRSKTPSHDE